MKNEPPQLRKRLWRSLSLNNYGQDYMSGALDKGGRCHTTPGKADIITRTESRLERDLTMPQDRSTLLVRHSDGKWQAPEIEAYENEGMLKHLLRESPQLIPMSTKNAAFVEELAVPQSGWVDLVGVDPNGAITLVECKLEKNPEIRRSVVGQLFAYASGLWEITYEEFDRAFSASSQGTSLADAVRVRLSESESADWNEEEFRAAVSHNLRAGRFTLIIAVDRITDELKRIVPYINSHTIPEVQFVALEIGYVKDGDVEIIRPLTYGQESAAEKQATGRSDQAHVNEVFRAIYRLAQQSGAFGQILSPPSDRAYYTVERTHKAVQYEPTFGWDQLRAEVVLNHARATVNVRLFELLKAREHSIQAAVNGDIRWNFQEGRKLQRLQVIRTIDRQNIAQSVDDLASWSTDRLVELRRAIEPGLAADLADAIAMAQPADNPRRETP